MNELKRLNLQLFAGEGTGEGGDGATSGGIATADAEQRLRELGVPEAKAKQRASKVASRMNESVKTDPKPTEEAKVESVPPTTDNPTEETQETVPSRMSWDEIMKDPEYNEKMQAMMKSRLKSAKAAEENLAKLTPAVELLARKYNLDPTNMDYDALNKAIEDDDDYYEEKALELGTSVETARKIDKMERDNAREQAQAERTLQEQKIQQHLIKLEQQGEALKKVFPNFDLRTELQNPAFARMTSPNVGISVEDAYYAVHRNEIQTASMQIAAQKTAEKLSNAIQSGSRRPDESGVSSQAPSVSTFDYRTASRDQREALKKRIRDAAARGEKLYPGQ
jgi:hypothetical protein